MASASLLPIGKRNSEPQAARHDSLVQDRSFLSRNTCPCLTQSLKGEGSSNRGVSKFFEISDWPEIATPLVSLDSYEFELGYQSLDGKTYSKKNGQPLSVGHYMVHRKINFLQAFHSTLL